MSPKILPFSAMLLFVFLAWDRANSQETPRKEQQLAQVENEEPVDLPPEEPLPEDYDDGGAEPPPPQTNGDGYEDENNGDSGPDVNPPERQPDPLENRNNDTGNEGANDVEDNEPIENDAPEEPNNDLDEDTRRPPIDRQDPPEVREPPQDAPIPDVDDGSQKKSTIRIIPDKAPGDDKIASDLIPEGQELVNIDFPEPTDIKDIIRAVSLWTGKNVILGRDVSGKVQMISPRKVTKVEAYQAFLSALNLLGLTTVETGKVIKIVPVRSAVKSNLKTFLGSSWTPLTDELITQIVPLKYIDAKEIQTTLSRIVSSNSMIAYPPTNTLIISDSGFKVRRILDIIALLDVQTQQPQLSIVPIRYGDAKAIGAMVQDIFRAQSTGSKKSSKTDYLSYKIMTDERTNSVVIFGPPRTIADVKALVRKFDVQVDDPTRQATIHVRPLDYADAKKLATTLSSLANGGASSSRTTRRPTVRRSTSGSSRRSTADTPSPVATLDDDVKITADESSNSLLITGSRAAYDALNSIIRKLDIRRSQVFVEAEILDINVEGGFRFETSIFTGYGKEQGTKVAYTWEAETMGPLIVSQAANSKDRSSISQGADAFANDLNIGILSGKSVNVPGIGEITPGALIKMIKTDSSARVLSSPHILTSNNEEAKIVVGEKLFFRESEISTSGTAVQNVKSEDVDLSLELKPNISHSNYVTLKIDLNANTGTINAESNLPSVNKRQTSQLVTVKNGQTVVISGLVQTSEFEVYRKIPLLGDIPILGWLFRNSTIQKRKSNLMIFLTPHIVHGANDLAAIYQKKVEERDEIIEKVYGSDYKDDHFYQILPHKEDGVYQADAFDVIDRRKQEERNRDLMRDMGYEADEIREINEQNEKSSGESTSQSEDESGTKYSGLPEDKAKG